MRSKEGSSDYRYFPEPDLVPVAPTAEMRAAVRAAMPELPAARRARLQAEWGITEHDARTLLTSEGLADYAEAAVAALGSGTAKDVVNWCLGEVLAHLNETGLSPEVLPLAPDGLAELVAIVADGTISKTQAKDVLDECLTEAKRPKQVVAERGLVQVSDAGELGVVIDELFAANPDDVAAYRSGDDKARKKKRGFFMGELMKATKGQANPQVLNQLLDEKLQG
jgi:aspartyl-tRNA(Asn)/glutamyl-tRNA(Gln) amidotransferase subunit B